MRIFTVVLVLIIALLTACSGSPAAPDSSSPGTVEEPSDKPTADVAKVSDYFPFTENVYMKYKGTGNEYAAYETYVDYVKNNVIQLRNSNGGTVMAIVYQLKDGMLKKIFSQGETYYRYDYTSMSTQDEVLLMEPLEKGTSWNLEDGSTRSITAIDKQVDTPSGVYEAIEVTTERESSTERSYFVKDIGLVKSEYVSSDNTMTVTSELEEINTDVPYTSSIRFYYPEFLKDRLVYINKDIDLYTNENIYSKFEKEFRTTPDNSGLSEVISPNTRILGCTIDQQNDLVKVDFTSSLVKEMNAGSGFEAMIIQSIVNTFGDYFGKSKVIITLEGKPYESGHILKKEGEYFTVNNDNINEF